MKEELVELHLEKLFGIHLFYWNKFFAENTVDKGKN